MANAKMVGTPQSTDNPPLVGNDILRVRVLGEGDKAPVKFLPVSVSNKLCAYLFNVVFLYTYK